MLYMNVKYTSIFFNFILYLKQLQNTHNQHKYITHDLDKYAQT
jgi:hypothetical protein